MRSFLPHRRRQRQPPRHDDGVRLRPGSGALWRARYKSLGGASTTIMPPPRGGNEHHPPPCMPNDISSEIVIQAWPRWVSLDDDPSHLPPPSSIIFFNNQTIRAGQLLAPLLKKPIQPIQNIPPHPSSTGDEKPPPLATVIAPADRYCTDAATEQRGQ